MTRRKGSVSLSRRFFLTIRMVPPLGWVAVNFSSMYAKAGILLLGFGVLVANLATMIELYHGGLWVAPA